MPNHMCGFKIRTGSVVKYALFKFPNYTHCKNDTKKEQFLVNCYFNDSVVQMKQLVNNIYTVFL